jgi:hypothetical protein
MNMTYIRNESGHFVCPVAGCGAIKERQNTMHYHMKTHAGAMTHVCHEPGCGASFVQKSGLDQHVAQKHSTVTAWACPCCSHTCKMKANLLIHVGRKHGSGWITAPEVGEAKSLGCTGCKKSFSSPGAYYYHAVQCFTAPPDIAEKLAMLE